MTNHEYTTRVLHLFAKHASCDLVNWTSDGETIRFCVPCSDAFEWGGADGETIKDDDLDALEQAFADCIAADEVTGFCEAPTLFVARKRQRVPMECVLDDLSPAVRKLFEAVKHEPRSIQNRWQDSRGVSTGGSDEGEEARMMLAILLLAIIPLELPVTETCDALEHNYVFDQCGKPVFEQAIAWRWNGSTSRYEVQAWWLIKHDHDAPSRDMLRFDGPMMRRVQTDRVFRSWTQYDQELNERKQLPVELRRGMRTFLEVD